MSKQYTRLRPHWRPTHDATPHGFARWIGDDGSQGWAKILNPDGHLVRQVWAQAPQAKILLRNHGISEQKSEMLHDPEGTAGRHIDFWCDWLPAQGLWDERHRLVLEGINEAAIWEPGVTEAADIYNAGLVIEGAINGLTMGVLQMNTGWPTNHGITDGPPDWSGFERTRQALVQHGGYLCLHEYWDRRGPLSDDWGWNPGRFTQLPDHWRGLPILITECGYDVAVNAPHGTPHHGWQGHLSADEYTKQLTDYDDLLRESGWDVRAAFIFTHDFDPPWGSFDTTPLVARLTDHAATVRNQVVHPPQQPLTTRLPSVLKENELAGGDAWGRALHWIFHEEGGYQAYETMRQNWTGGEVGVGKLKGSKYGIYASRYPAVNFETLTETGAAAMHLRDHWLATQADLLDWPLCLVVFDTAVVHGAAQAIQWRDESPTAAHFVSKRLASYPFDPGWDEYGAGWTNRVARLLAEMGSNL